MRYPGARFRLFVVTYLKDERRLTARVRAKDKRRAKTLARQKFGSAIHIIAAVRWQDYSLGRRR